MRFLTLPPIECAFQPSFPWGPISFQTLIWALISCIVHHRVLSCCPFKTFHCFHLGKSPITIRPLWKLFSSSIWAGCPLQFNHLLRNPCISHHLQNLPFRSVAHYNETILKNPRISHHLKIFYLGWLPITMKPFWEIFAFLTTSKNLCIFHHGEKSCVFHPGRSLITTRPLWKISVFFISLKNLHVFHPGRSPITTRPLWKIFVFFTISKKNLCVFHPGKSPIIIRPPQKTFFNFLWVGHPWQFDHFKISEFSKEKSLLWVRFLALKRIHHLSIWWVRHLSFFFFFFTMLTI